MRAFKRPMEVDATQWFKMGDHPSVEQWNQEIHAPPFTCKRCSHPMTSHGHIYTLEGGNNVCPGDWIIVDDAKVQWSIDPDRFDETYDLEDDINISAEISFSKGVAVVSLVVIGAILLWWGFK